MKIKNDEIDVWAVLKKYTPELYLELKNNKRDGISFTQDGYYGNSMAEIMLLGCTVKAAGQAGREVIVVPHGTAFPPGGAVIQFDPDIDVIQEGHQDMNNKPDSDDVRVAQEGVRNEPYKS